MKLTLIIILIMFTCNIAFLGFCTALYLWGGIADHHKHHRQAQQLGRQAEQYLREHTP